MHETSDPENASDQTETAQENLSKKIKETYSQNEDWQDKYMRVLADLENLKRRQIKERKTQFKGQDHKFLVIFFLP